MDKDTKDTAREILSFVAKGKKYTELKDFHTLFMDAESIISALAYLVGPKSNLEHQYRMLKVKYMDEGRSHAESEARAKASEVYKEFRKIESVCEIAIEQIQLLKKFKGDLELEYKRS